MDINLVPTELIIKIFDYLDQKSILNLPKVCRRWRIICEQHKKIDLVRFNWMEIKKGYKNIDSIFSRFHKIQGIFLDYKREIYEFGTKKDREIREKMLDLLPQHVQNLKRIIIYKNGSLKDIRDLLNPNLTELHLFYCHSITNESFHTISKICSKLKVLSLQTQEMKGSSLINIAKNCPKLCFLDVGSCINLSIDEITKIWAWIPDLEYLSLRHFATNDTYENFEPLISSIADGCKKLKAINFESSHISDSDILMLKAFPNLKSLNIRCCELIHNQGLINVSKLIDLTEILIGLNSVTNYEIDVITKTCTKLKLFDISHSLFVTQKGMNSIIQNAPQIENLNVYNCFNLKINVNLLNVLKTDLKMKTLCISWRRGNVISKEKYPFVIYDESIFERSHYTYYVSTHSSYF